MPGIGSINIDLVANTAMFVRNMDEAKKSSQTFGTMVGTFVGGKLREMHQSLGRVVSTLTSVKTAVIGAGAAFGAFRAVSSLGNAAEKVEEIGRAAARLGIGVEKMSLLRYVAEQSDVDFQTLASSAGKAAKNIAEMADSGVSKLRLGRFNIDLKDTKGHVREIGDLLPEIARGISSASSQASKLLLSEKIFGRGGGQEFVTLLQETGGRLENLTEQEDRARRLHLIFGEDTVRVMKAYGDAIKDVRGAFFSLQVAVMEKIGPTLTRMLNDVALRVADLAPAVGSIVRAIDTAAGEGVSARQASVFLHVIADQGFTVFTTVLKGAASVFVTVISEGLQAAFTILARNFADMYRDYLPTWAQGAVGVTSVGSQSAIDNLRAKRASVLTMQADVQRLTDAISPASQPYSTDLQGRRKALEAMIESILSRKGSVDEAVQVIDKLIDAQDRALKLNEGQGAQVDAQQVAGATSAIIAEITKQTENVKRAMAGLDAAVNATETAFPDGSAYGPPAPAQQRFKSIFVSLRDLADQAQTAGENFARRLRVGAEKEWPGFEKFMESRVKYAEGLLGRADKILEEIHPENKIRAQIDEVNQLKAALDRMGMGWKLSREEVEAYIIKVQGLTEAKAKIRTFATDIRDAISGFSMSASDAFADMLVSGKTSFAQLAQSWTKTLIAMATQQFIFKRIFDGIGNAVGGWLGQTAAGQTPSVNQTPAPNAKGNVFWHGAVVPYRSGGLAQGMITDRVIFPMRGGRIGLAGEAGEEYSVEPVRLPSGKLGVRAGGGGTVVNVIDQRGGGEPVAVRSSSGPNGQQQISILIRDEVRKSLADGSMDRVLRANYGIPRAARGN